jgi:hypothetical protein
MKRKPRNPTVSRDVGYSGPPIPSILRDDNRIDREIFQQTSSYGLTSAAQSIVLSSDIVTAAPPSFLTYQTNYKEYRVLALSVHYMPGFKYSGIEQNTVASISSLPTALYTMREDLSPASISQFDANPTSARLVPANEGWVEVIKARGTAPMEWNITGTGQTLAQVMAVKFSIQTTGSAGPDYASARTVWLVEFRGRV